MNRTRFLLPAAVLCLSAATACEDDAGTCELPAGTFRVDVQVQAPSCDASLKIRTEVFNWTFHPRYSDNRACGTYQETLRDIDFTSTGAPLDADSRGSHVALDSISSDPAALANCIATVTSNRTYKADGIVDGFEQIQLQCPNRPLCLLNYAEFYTRLTEE